MWKEYLYPQIKRMKIENKKVITLNYSLSAKEKDQALKKHIEKTTPEHPFVFIFGAGFLLEAFEKELRGKKTGDGFDFEIEAARAYGHRNEKYMMEIPIDNFRAEDGTIDLNRVSVGKTLHMVSDDKGRLEGLVTAITASHVKMDFNHALAGMDLHFSGEVLSVRDATAEELSHGHVHGPGGHHH